jgi:CubicO group peptidase (beta-lactamase class C family)
MLLTRKGAGLMLACGLFLAAANAGMAQTPQNPPWSVPSDAEIHKILVDRIDTAKQGVGLVVGVIDPKGRRIVAYGALNQGDARTLNGDTEFEIGSVTKVFTSLLLADMVQHGEVSLDDPAAKYLPPNAKLPERGGKQITLIDLATHTSGLPRQPGNLKPADLNNPYADYTVDQLYQFLGSYALTRDIGAKYEYSNLGVGLLGHVLSRRAGMDYEALVRRRITAPLGMKDTVITLSPDQLGRLAVGHNASLQPTENWNLPALASAGALRSTANDLLTFLGAELGYGDNPLKASMAVQLSVRRPTGAPSLATALAWLVLTAPGGTVIWHDGETGGYRSFIAFDPATRTGVVVLANAATTAGPDDIGLHLLAGTPLANPQPHTEVALDTKTKQAFAGRYQLAPNFILTVTLEGDRLFGQATGQPKFEMFPESPTQLFYKVVDAQVRFSIGADGRATGIVLHQNGRDLPGARVE